MHYIVKFCLRKPKNQSYKDFVPESLCSKALSFQMGEQTVYIQVYSAINRAASWVQSSAREEQAKTHCWKDKEGSLLERGRCSSNTSTSIPAAGMGQMSQKHI